jgi:hypothetical protein
MEKQLSFPFWSTSVGPISQLRFIEKFNDISDQEEFDLSEEEIGKLVDSYEEKGFKMLQAWSQGFHSPERLLLPSKKIYTFKELLNAKDDANLDCFAQEELLSGIKYWRLVDSQQYQEMYRSYYSFLDKEDEKAQFIKFQNEFNKIR